jgi:LAS superfamily LD-carboxypeptidase LdcB
MSPNPSPSTPTGRVRSIVLAVLAVGTSLAGVFVWQFTVASDASVPDVKVWTNSRPVGMPALGNDTTTAELDPDLAAALRRATADARVDGVDIQVTSGRRSAEHQERLLRDAIGRYGSKEEAARWVATPETSPHVSGDAIDVGPKAATDWLAQHGAAYGLCQIYANESWHYELRLSAVDEGCPEMYADPTEDPRMR